MAALYCLIGLIALVATYLFVIYLKEYAREEESIKNLLKSQEKFAKEFAGGQPMYFDLDPATAKELMKAYSDPAPAKKTSNPPAIDPATKKKIIN